MPSSSLHSLPSLSDPSIPSSAGSSLSTSIHQRRLARVPDANGDYHHRTRPCPAPFLPLLFSLPSFSLSHAALPLLSSSSQGTRLPWPPIVLDAMDPCRISLAAAPPCAIVLRFLQPPRSLRRRRETSSFRRPAGGPCRLVPHRRRPDLQARAVPGHLVTGNGFPNPGSDASRRPRHRSLQQCPKSRHERPTSSFRWRATLPLDQDGVSLVHSVRRTPRLDDMDSRRAPPSPPLLCIPLLPPLLLRV